MPRYRVAISFTGYRDVSVKADSVKEAQAKAQALLDSGDIEPERTVYLEQSVQEAELMWDESRDE